MKLGDKPDSKGNLTSYLVTLDKKKKKMMNQNDSILKT